MEVEALTLGIQDQKIQLFRSGKWQADVEVDWPNGVCHHLPHRARAAEPLLNELLVLLQCNCFLVAPVFQLERRAMQRTDITAEAVPLFVTDGQLSHPVDVMPVNEEVLHGAIEQQRALVASYRALHQSTSRAGGVPKALGLRVLNISEFPVSWAHIAQFAMIPLLTRV